jgi:RNA polymerase sigma factor (sigma-70 family)
VDHDSRNLSDFQLCHECLEGKVSAIAQLQKEYGPVTISYLVGAGARPSEASEVVNSLWADLLAPVGDRLPRLGRYDGSCALQTWLNTVALNRLLTRKRTEQRWDRLIPAHVGGNGADGEGEDELPRGWRTDVDDSEPGEAPLIEIMRVAVETAFLTCEPEDFVLLQLKHCDGLLGAELGLMFGCDASVISRRIDKAENHIAAATLWQVRQTDPWLELKWTDFVELCRTATPACFGLD